jgi:hypothetical protein
MVADCVVPHDQMTRDYLRRGNVYYQPVMATSIDREARQPGRKSRSSATHLHPDGGGFRFHRVSGHG